VQDLEREVREALSSVHDPEIPPCSITDLGLVERVAVTGDRVEVDLVPTFLGCPALEAIREDAEAAVRAVAGGRAVRVRFVPSPPWTTDRITPRGRAALRSYGIAPPGDPRSSPRPVPLAAVGAAREGAPCPFCGSRRTEVESAYGPTLCRTVQFCRSCRNPFEAFRPKG
jgi:ring-1,2-phenylacetyl-CoA epoxidase subunit PaaD